MMQQQNKRIVDRVLREMKRFFPALMLSAVFCSAVLTAYLISLCPRV